MSTPVTYSFLDVHAAISGPGGGFSIGSGAGVAEEGISLEPNEDIDTLTIGADGEAMHSLSANKSAKCTIRLLKTSPINAQLQAMLAFQRSSSVAHGQNTISVTNPVSGDAITLQQTAFARQPTVTYSKVGDMLEWSFNSGKADFGLGAGVQ